MIAFPPLKASHLISILEETLEALESMEVGSVWINSVELALYQVMTFLGTHKTKEEEVLTLTVSVFETKYPE
eukprot:m.97022 g.97022  ORF g.97022 m.97022 type:complete len:72 (+) comp36928_c0_seq35:1413-1628(+)